MKYKLNMVNTGLVVILLTVLLVSCGKNYVPKPHGYLKVHYPEKEYIGYDSAAPYYFEYPVYARVLHSESRISEPYWYDVYLPEYKGTIYISYKALDDNLEDIIADTRSLVYKHTSRSDGILETPFVNPDQRKFGLLYELKGDVASSVQFFLTDSTAHFLRGSLYFETSPNRDSLNPVIEYVTEDIVHMIESLRWK